MPVFEYIKDQQSFDNLIEQYQQSEVLILDTEFVRTRTYFAKLGLLQAYDGKRLALIDPNNINDLSQFWALLENQNIVKVLHSCSEDLELFFNYGKCQPFPLFDSQIAASLVGMGYGIGYAKLVESCLAVSIDKGESRTDWLKRPLTDAQLNYAANDVFYLYDIYFKLKQSLENKGRLHWLFSEGKRMTDIRIKPINLEQAYLKVKNANQLSQLELGYLKTLATWRLEKAIEKDLAVGFVLKDNSLIALAKKQPRNINAILRMFELSEHEKRLYGNEIINIINNTDLSVLPDEIDILAFRKGYKEAFKVVKAVLASICENNDIPVEMLASKRLINEYLQWIWNSKQTEVPLLLLEWRNEFTNESLQKLALDFHP